MVGKVPFDRWDADAVAAHDGSTLCDEVKKRMAVGVGVQQIHSFFHVILCFPRDPKEGLDRGSFEIEPNDIQFEEN